MDELTAYRILRIQEGSTIQEIKDAYASLSKEFHPEEHPEEFQQIHEAYTVLTRRRRSSRVINPREERKNQMYVELSSEDELWEKAEKGIKKREEEETFRKADQKTMQKKAEEETRWRDLERKGVSGTRTEAPEKTKDTIEKMFDKKMRYASEEETIRRPDNTDQEVGYDFDSALHHAKREEQESLHKQTGKALTEMQILLTPEYMYKLKLFKAFFKKQEYQEALKSPEFMHEFALLLKDSHLKKRIYDYFIDYYRLRGMTRSQLIPEAKELYDVLERKRGMNAKNKDNLAYVIPPAIVIGARAGLRGVDFSMDIFIGFCVVILFIIAGIWLYRKLYENHSSIFAQAIVAIIVIAVQIILMFANLGESVDIISALAFMAAVIWLMIAGIIGIILKIRNSVIKNGI